MNNNEEKILKLTKIWYSIINCGYHEDGDCHFKIDIAYSCYHAAPKYYVQHYGYILGDIEASVYDSYEEAQAGLIELLVNGIKYVYTFANTTIKDFKKGEDLIENYEAAKKQIKIIEDSEVMDLVYNDSFAKQVLDQFQKAINDPLYKKSGITVRKIKNFTVTF